MVANPLNMKACGRGAVVELLMELQTSGEREMFDPHASVCVADVTV